MKTLHSARLGRRIVLTGAATLALGGCFGSFNAVRSLWAWNSEVSDSKWVNWLVFLGLSIIPVYLLFFIGDTLVLNSVEFWTGSNPVKVGKDGRSVTRVATADPDRLRIEVHRNGELEQAFYFQRTETGALLILDERGQLLSMVSEDGDGGLELRAGDRALLARLDPAAVRRVGHGIEQGQHPHPLLRRELGDDTWQLARSGTLDAALPGLL